ncbi:unnamed protein product [Boreogadus saida]
MECRSLLCKIHFTEAKYETNLQQVGVYCLGQRLGDYPRTAARAQFERADYRPPINTRPLRAPGAPTSATRARGLSWRQLACDPPVAPCPVPAATKGEPKAAPIVHPRRTRPERKKGRGRARAVGHQLPGRLGQLPRHGADAAPRARTMRRSRGSGRDVV